MDYVLDNPTKAQRRACMVVYQTALDAGRLVKAADCAWCGDSSNIEGHHPDYARPLMVVWLCRKCHRAHHKEYWLESRLFTGEREESRLAQIDPRAGPAGQKMCSGRLLNTGCSVG